MRGCAEGNQGGHGDAHEGVEGIPEEIEGGYLVGEELDGKQGERCADDPPIVEQMKAGGQLEQVEVGQQSERGDRGIDIEPGGKANGDDQARELRACEREMRPSIYRTT